MQVLSARTMPHDTSVRCRSAFFKCSTCLFLQACLVVLGMRPEPSTLSIQYVCSCSSGTGDLPGTIWDPSGERRVWCVSVLSRAPVLPLFAQASAALSSVCPGPFVGLNMVLCAPWQDHMHTLPVWPPVRHNVDLHGYPPLHGYVSSRLSIRGGTLRLARIAGDEQDRQLALLRYAVRYTGVSSRARVGVLVQHVSLKSPPYTTFCFGKCFFCDDDGLPCQ